MDWFTQVVTALTHVWTMQAPQALLSTDGALSVALGIVVLASASWVLGHAVIFGINRVTGLRMVAAVTIGIGYVALARGLMALTVAIIVSLLAGPAIGASAGLAYLFALAPLALSVLVFIPHLGLGVGRLLEVWSVLALAAILAQAVPIGSWAGLAIAGGAWLLGYLASRLAARPVARVTAWIWTLATGTPTFVTARDVLTGAPFIPVQREAAR
ncbi:MAG: hypothetical protein ACK5H2_04530 [Beutenbergiaceae bacterium]